LHFSLDQQMKIDNQQHDFDDERPKGVVRTLQRFRAGSSEFGIFAEEIAAVVTWREPVPLPDTPKSVLGVVSIQGRMLTVLDLAILPMREANSIDAPREAPGYIIALRGDEQLALAVEAMGETIDFADSDFSGQGETAGKLISRVLHCEGAEINILNLKELFPTAIQGRERRRRRF
jgi:chemotaxis signal transduction protein